MSNVFIMSKKTYRPYQPNQLLLLPLPCRTGFRMARLYAIGWGVLAEVPGREIVMGAVTQPWLADVVFRPIPPEEFASFHEPDRREDRLDVARGLARCQRIDFSHGDTGCSDRFNRAREVPAILVPGVARHHRDSVAAARTVESGGGAPCAT